MVGVLALTTGPQPPGRLDIAGNIALFVPLGALLALRWPALAPLVVVVVGSAASGAIEAAQLLVLTARDASLNDLALNTSGAALGWVGGRTLTDVLRWGRRTGSGRRRLG